MHNVLPAGYESIFYNVFMPSTTKENLIECFNPATGEKIAQIKASGENEVKEKAKRAKDAFFFWSTLNIDKRIQYLSKIYNLIIEGRDNIAKTITKNNGKPLAESYLTEIASTLQVMEHFIKNGKELLDKKNIRLGPLYPTKKSYISYEPIGTVAMIEPWNYPFYLPFSVITKTLLCGNTFLFKPSSTVSVIGKLIEDILIASGLPEGVSNVVYGNSDLAKCLIEADIDKVVFTGSTSVGKEIASTCAKRLIPLSLELGGKDPAIVLKSTNIDYAARGILWGAVSNCGQACASIERVYVESGIYKEFVEKITHFTNLLKVGDGMSEDTDVGPLINNEQLLKVEEHINDAINKGAKVHTGGKRITGPGFFFEPTVLSNVNHSMKIMTEETFGPVIPLMKFDGTEEVIKYANDTKYGLSASIWAGDTKATKEMAERLNCGTVWINDSLFLQAHPACPWTGYKESGYGSLSIYDFLKTKHISTDQGFIPGLRPKSYWWFPYKGKAKSYSDLIEVLFKFGLKEKAKAAFETMINFLK